MKTQIKATLAAVLMSSVALGTVTTVATFASVEPAYAKSDKASSKSGESRGRSDTARGKFGERGKSSERTSSRGKSDGSLEGFFAKLTGRSARADKAQRPAKSAKSEQIAQSRKAEEGTLHPSELGNMNGALNANINAVLAHIRNGNGNGPVGHIAVLVAASAMADGSQEVLDRAALFTALEASPYDTLDDYFLALEGVPGNSVDLIIEEAADQDQAAIDAGFTSYEDYQNALAVPPAEPDPSIESALTALGVDPENRDDVPEDLALDPSDPSVSVAEESLADESAAEESILAYWNKNPGGEGDPDTGLTPEEEQLLTELRDRFSEDDLIAIEAAAEEASAGSEIDDDSCDELDEVCEPEEDVVILID